MAKLIRVAALVLCMLMLLPSSLAMAAVAGGQDDIIDDESATAVETANPADLTSASPAPAADAPSFADLASMDTTDANAGSADAETASVITNAPVDGTVAPAETTSLTAPSFGSVDTTKSVTMSAADSLTNAGGGAQQAADITKNCKYKATEGKMGALVDSKLNTYWVNKKKAKISIAIPANDTAGGMYIEWFKKPANYTLIEYDAAGKDLQSRDQSTYTGLVSVYPLLPETKKIVLEFGKKVALSTLRIFSQGAFPTSIQDWQAPHEKADLMVVSTHQDDEFLYFGGAIPYYNAVRGKAVQVVYMANCGRARYAEALNGLWYAGLRNAPDFIGLPDKLVKNLKNAKKVWKTDTVIEQLVARIRKYKPEVIVSHDPKGEYGHGQHMLTAECLKQAVELAADETKYKASADAYGVWQVQKLYLHLYPEKQITMDWKTAAPELDGKTPSEVAKLAYAAHKSQQKNFTYEEGGKYDNSKFGLAFTMVGDDEKKNDFFENIVEGAARLSPVGTMTDETAEQPTTEDGETQPDENYFDDEDSLTDESLSDEELSDDGLTGYDDESFDDSEPTNDGYEGDDAEVTPPVETGTPANTAALLGTLIGVPVVLGGSAIGTATVRKSMKKKRRAARKAEKDKMSA